MTPLHFAALQGHLEVIRLLVERGADVDGLSGPEHTPMSSARLSGQWEAYSLLEELGGYD